MAHYDSVENSPGAADNASGVAVVLETLRALKSRPPINNDVIALFTDGEEDHFPGASAFVNGHRWLADIKIVLNLDTFTTGPAVIWRISPENGWLVQALAHANDHPIVTPILCSNRVPVGWHTDFDIFLDQLEPFGLPGWRSALFITSFPINSSPGKGYLALAERSHQSEFIVLRGHPYVHLSVCRMHHPGV